MFRFSRFLPLPVWEEMVRGIRYRDPRRDVGRHLSSTVGRLPVHGWRDSQWHTGNVKVITSVWHFLSLFFIPRYIHFGYESLETVWFVCVLVVCVTFVGCIRELTDRFSLATEEVKKRVKWLKRRDSVNFNSRLDRRKSSLIPTASYRVLYPFDEF